MATIDETEKIAEVLLDSGEDEFTDEAKTVKDVLDRGGAALDNASLCNVVVVRTESGKFLVGEFGFEFCAVDEEEARRVAKDFGADEEDEDPPRGHPDIQGISAEKAKQIVEEFKKGETPKEE
jgi:hypothetical protein